jgi:proteasome lid subunit RPN8/RPN11
MLTVPAHILADMVAHAREVKPYECCGLLAGTAGVVTQQYRITNRVAREPQAEQLFAHMSAKNLNVLSERQRAEVAYFMDTGEQARAQRDWQQKGLDLLVVYHSHPASPPYPSDTDIKLAQAPLTFYPDLTFLIISLMGPVPDIKAHRILKDHSYPVEFKTV